MMRVECLLRAGPGAPLLAAECAHDLALAGALKPAASSAFEAAVREVAALVFRSGPPSPAQLRLVGVTTNRRTRIMLVWSGPALDWTRSLPAAPSSVGRFSTIRRLVDDWHELTAGARRCVILAANSAIKDQAKCSCSPGD